MSSSVVPALIATSSEVLLFVETAAAAAATADWLTFHSTIPTNNHNSTISLIIPAAAAHDDDFSLMNADDSGESCGCCCCSLACLPLFLFASLSRLQSPSIYHFASVHVVFCLFIMSHPFFFPFPSAMILQSPRMPSGKSRPAGRSGSSRALPQVAGNLSQSAHSTRTRGATEDLR